MVERDISPRVWLIALCGLFLFSFFLRFPYPSPSWWHVDERAFVLHPLGLWSGDLNPHFFNYPTLPFYLSSLLYYGYYLLSYSGSVLHFVAERYFVGGHDLIVLARSFHSLQSALTGVFCALVGRHLFGARVGLLVGISFAVLPLSVRFAHLATVDTGQVLWQMVSLFFAVRLVHTGGMRAAVGAGVCAGLATASKYPGVLAFFPLLIACAVAPGTRRQQGQILVLASFGGLATFFCTSPYVVLDFSSAWASLSGMGSEHLLSASHEGEGFSLWHHIRYNLRYGVGLLGVVALAVGLLYRVGRYRAVDWVLLSAVLVQLVFLSVSSSVFMRYALPLAPLVVLVWGRLLWLLPKGKWIWLAVAVLLWSEPLYGTWQTRSLLSGEDTRGLAKQWVEKNVPEGTWIVGLGAIQAGPALVTTAEIFAREYQFTESYKRSTLVEAYAWLMQHDELPPLYLKVSPQRLRKVVAPGAGRGHAVVVDCLHPICGDPGTDGIWLRERAVWLEEWWPEGARDAVFDIVDWYFLPMGSYGASRRSGPGLQLGYIATNEPQRPGSTADFFYLMHGLIELEGNVANGDWASGLERSRELRDSSLLNTEVLSRAHLYRFFYYAGLCAFKERDFTAARAHWRQAARIEVADLAPETRAQMLTDLGMAHVQLEEYEKGLEVWRMAATLDVNNSQVRYYMGRIILDHLLDGAIALAAADAALELRPDYVDALLLRGEALASLGRKDEALAAYRRAQNMAPKDERIDQLVNALKR
ncbi:MAG: hypothetical protein ACI8PG_001082 [Planctomycetota bacterium]|jgi:hypothetical protein